MPFCSRCGIQNDENSRYCKSCGTALTGTLVSTSQFSRPAPPPLAIPVVPVVYAIRPPKSVGVAIVLAIFFGPLGMLYSTVSGALIMIFVSIVLAAVTAGVSAFITWPVCVIWAAIAAQRYNEGRG